VNPNAFVEDVKYNVKCGEMNRRRKIVIPCIIMTVGVALFLFAPVVFWYNPGPLNLSPGPESVFRSLGCTTLGLGDTYSSHQGLHLTCKALDWTLF
jgi:hypothetical protein